METITDNMIDSIKLALDCDWIAQRHDLNKREVYTLLKELKEMGGLEK